MHATIRAISGEECIRLMSDGSERMSHREEIMPQDASNAVYLGIFLFQRFSGFVLLTLDNKDEVIPYTEGRHCAYVADSYIDTPLIGYGLYDRLLEAAEDAARQRGIPYLCVDAFYDENDRRLYARYGYHAVGEPYLYGHVYVYDHWKGGTYQEEWHVNMIKKVSP